MNIEVLIRVCRDVVAAHEAHVKANRSDDTWDVVQVAEHTLLNLEGVPMPTAGDGTQALARLVIAAFEAGVDSGLKHWSDR